MSDSTLTPPDNDNTASNRARIAAKGGNARATKLTSGERTESARKAAETRWKNDANKNLPKETHDGAIPLGAISIECGNLDNGVRVLSTRGVSRAFGRTKTGTNITGTNAPQLPPFLAAQNIFPYISDELHSLLKAPIRYRPKRGEIGHGYDATLLPDICGVILDAENAGVLRESQEELVEIAQIMLRGFAKVGIIALVDEATGYQADRRRDELSLILKAYIAEELQPWISRFPHEFFKHIHRLWRWEYRDESPQGPRYVGKLINVYIYERLPPGVLQELRDKNPAINGRRKNKIHQWLTDDTGIPHLDRLISDVTTLLAVSDDKGQFDYMLKKRYPKKGDQLVIAATARVEPRDDDE